MSNRREDTPTTSKTTSSPDDPQELQVHLRHCLLYEFQLGHTAAEATHNICHALGESAVSARTSRKWFSRFREGHTDLGDLPRTGRPVESEESLLISLLNSNPKQSIRELAVTLGWSHMSVQRHLHSLGKVYRIGSWIPHNLSQRDLDERSNTCYLLLSRSRRFDWLDSLLTGDEKWCLYVNPTRKGQWIEPNQKPEPTPKGESHPQKLLISVWWDVRGVVYWEALPHGTTITASLYCQQLERVDAALKESRPEMNKVLFLHDNARPHSAKVTHDKILELDWELLPHPPYSPDLAPTDFHLFRSLQDHLKGKTFNNQEVLKTEVQNFFSSKPASFYREGIHCLPDRWRKVVELDGHYIVE